MLVDETLFDEAIQDLRFVQYILTEGSMDSLAKTIERAINKLNYGCNCKEDWKTELTEMD